MGVLSNRVFILGIWLSLSFNSAFAVPFSNTQVFGDLFEATWAIETEDIPGTWSCEYPGSLQTNTCTGLTEFKVTPLSGVSGWFPPGTVFNMLEPEGPGQSISASIAGSQETLSGSPTEVYYFITDLVFSLTQSIAANVDPDDLCATPATDCATQLLYDSSSTEANAINCQEFASGDVLCGATDPLTLPLEIPLDRLLGVAQIPNLGTAYLLVTGLLGLAVLRPVLARRITPMLSS